MLCFSSMWWVAILPRSKESVQRSRLWVKGLWRVHVSYSPHTSDSDRLLGRFAAIGSTPLM
jgi:hypothetical protein